ncbi:MAG: 2OG-Fe dioxygenase family protein [Rubrivivax sp.]|nr:2OG-Fe dioxygenase family protein [Rubrivivax sp.]
MNLDPPQTPLPELQAQLARTGWAVLSRDSLAALSDIAPAQLQAWHHHWDALPPDHHLRDGGRYRRRRHGCFVVDKGVCRPVQQRPHWQPVEYNALHGGIERHFEPLPPALLADPAWLRLLQRLGTVATALRGAGPWYAEAHPFRIEATGGIGRPTPEGAHRDGVDLVAVIFVGRHNVKGGETRVFDARGPQGVRFTLFEPFSALVLDDERVIHESTPIQPLNPAEPSWRDTLVLTFRRHGFQGPDPAAASAP